MPCLLACLACLARVCRRGGARAGCGGALRGIPGGAGWRWPESGWEWCDRGRRCAWPGRRWPPAGARWGAARMVSEFLPFIVAGIATGAILGLAGTGLVLTYKTSGIFNFGQGAVAAAAAYVFYGLEQGDKWPWWLAFIVVVFIMGPLFGLLMEHI